MYKRQIQQYVGEKKIDVLTLHIYFGQSENISTLYEDDGNGYAYEEEGAFNIKTFNTINENNSFFIKQNSEEKYETEYKSYEIILHGFDSINSVFCDNEELHVKNSNYLDNEVYVINTSTNFKEIIVK